MRSRRGNRCVKRMHPPWRDQYQRADQTASSVTTMIRHALISRLDRNFRAANARSASGYWTAAWPSAASTGSTTPGTATCAATARCRRPLPNPPPQAGEEGVGVSASSAPSPTLPASPTSATPSPSPVPPATHGIEAYCRVARPRSELSKIGTNRPTCVARPELLYARPRSSNGQHR